MIHYTTTNISFLKMFHILKELGIKENNFFLHLEDETLLNVNPLDADSLTEEQKFRIIQEITINPWYLIRELITIPESGNVRFELNRGNLAILWAMFNNLNFYCLLPRQCTKTYTVCCGLYYINYWKGNNTHSLHFSYQESILKSNLQRIKSIRDNLPVYMKLHNPRVDKDNENEMHYKLLGNYIKIKAPSKSKDDANKIGRGFSTPIQWYDEFAFIPNIKEQYEASRFSFSTVSEVAKKSGNQTFIGITTTAGFLNTDEGKWTFNFLNRCADFTETLYDMPLPVLHNYIKNNSRNNFIRIEFMYYDLGKPDSYIEEQQKEVSEDAIDREIKNMWKDVTTEHPLGQERVSILMTSIIEPRRAIVIDDLYLLKFYVEIEDLDPLLPYILSLDCGGNLRRDFTALTVTDPRTFEVIATMRTNSYSTTRFAKAVAKLLLGIFIGGILVAERNSMGITVLDTILDVDYSLTARVYFDKDDKPGIFTDKMVRDLLYNTILKNAVVEDGDLIHDRNIINEVQTLTITRTGRIDHEQGQHDDSLVSYLLGRYFLSYAKNKQQYIDPNIIGIGKNKLSIEYSRIVEDKKMNNRRLMGLDKNNMFGFMDTMDVNGKLNDIEATRNTSSNDMFNTMMGNISKKSKSMVDEFNNIDEVDVHQARVANEEEMFDDDEKALKGKFTKTKPGFVKTKNDSVAKDMENLISKVIGKKH